MHIQGCFETCKSTSNVLLCFYRGWTFSPSHSSGLTVWNPSSTLAQAQVLKTLFGKVMHNWLTVYESISLFAEMLLSIHVYIGAWFQPRQLMMNSRLARPSSISLRRSGACKLTGKTRLLYTHVICKTLQDSGSRPVATPLRADEAKSANGTDNSKEIGNAEPDAGIQPNQPQTENTDQEVVESSPKNGQAAPETPELNPPDKTVTPTTAKPGLKRQLTRQDCKQSNLHASCKQVSMNMQKSYFIWVCVLCRNGFARLQSRGFAGCAHQKRNACL